MQIKISTLVLFSTLLCVAHADKFCFVVSGDGRANGVDPSENGVNTLITGEIAKAALAEKAKFLLWSGDLVTGSQDPGEFEKQLLAWRKCMEPLYTAGIPVLPCRGNHDTTGPKSAWDKVFSGPYALPANGPETEKNLTWFYENGPVLFIGLDEYSMPDRETVNQQWLNGVLQEHKKPFVFAMGHEPAFMDGKHEDTLDADPGKRDALWNSLIAAGSRVFFAGHDHLYDHMLITREGTTPGPEMHQLVAGIAGAPFYRGGDYTGINAGWKLKRVSHIEQTYGYILVEIDGDKATITFKGRTAPNEYKPMDTFSYTAK